MITVNVLQQPEMPVSSNVKVTLAPLVAEKVMLAFWPGVVVVTDPCVDVPAAGKLMLALASRGTLETVTLAVPVTMPR